jgi:hypothetical protein
VDKTRVAEPGERIVETTERQSRTQQQRLSDEQGRSHMAEGAGMLAVNARVDDFKRMQGRVADLHNQRRKAEACEKNIRSSVIELMLEGNSQASLRPLTRSHDESRTRILW